MKINTNVWIRNTCLRICHWKSMVISLFGRLFLLPQVPLEASSVLTNSIFLTKFLSIYRFQNACYALRSHTHTHSVTNVMYIIMTRVWYPNANSSDILGPCLATICNKIITIQFQSAPGCFCMVMIFILVSMVTDFCLSIMWQR